ncbi:MAG TPA: ABA4-like family protein [Lacibacter sp.]|nr:ABA4-like family protein [Lacibacter sp.]HMO89678.1 ABA4-like family protein [Lacibacter sp.]HMP86221.1 ABA4-like family protein [Lacibacter sp.]
MTPDIIFQITNTLALSAWLVLILLSPFWFDTDKLLIGVVITLLAIVYAWLINQSFSAADFEKFSTLEGLMSLFTNKTAVAAGWVHYLAFDLMTGIWIRRNALQHGIRHWLIVPCLVFTFILGPFGLLLYLLLRWLVTKQYFADNY